MKKIGDKFYHNLQVNFIANTFGYTCVNLGIFIVTQTTIKTRAKMFTKKPYNSKTIAFQLIVIN
jgi:hypothetical protein